MKRSLLLGTIAAVALATTSQAQSYGDRHVVRRVVSRPDVTTTAPATNRHGVRNYSRSGRYYYSGGRYYSGHPYYYNSGPVVSVGFGGYYPGYYDYGYPYGYAYGGDYPYSTYGPVGYARTIYTTRNRDLAYDDNVVIAVQERLARAGYYRGMIDGVAGPETRSAVARWEANHGLAATGAIDRETLDSMGIG